MHYLQVRREWRSTSMHHLALEDLTPKQRTEVWRALYCSKAVLDSLKGTVDLRQVRRGRPLGQTTSRNLRNGLQSSLPFPCR